MLRRLLACLVLILAPLAAGAAEEILDFDVLVEVQPDGALLVTETIRVRAEGAQIQRGIYRDFPVRYREADGAVSLATFDVEWVRRNGVSEPFAVLSEGSNKRLRIGQSDVLLPVPSEQVYSFRYRTEGHLRAQDGFDELFWNVTGNDWAFPILASSVEIRLPRGVPIIDHAGYTGFRGDRGDALRVLGISEGRYLARTTETLFPGQGWSVAISWPQGMIDIPPVQYAAGSRPAKMLGATPMTHPAGVLATLIGAAALLFGWMRVGRDPRGGAIYPRFDPPEGLSPAAMRFVKRQGFDRRCLTAAILSMAVKGAVRITEEPASGILGRRTYTLAPLGRKGKPLSRGEAGAYDKLFAFGQSLTLKSDKSNGGRVDRARAELSSRLWEEHYGASFRRNARQTFLGVLAGIVAGVALVGIASNGNPSAILVWVIAALVAGVATLIVGAILIAVLAGRSAGLGGRGSTVLVMVASFGGIFAVQGAIFALAMYDQGQLTGLGPVSAAGAAFGVIAGTFHYLMAAPTKAGRNLLDAIEGFEMYMATAEEDRLNLLNPPEHTPELFEKLLPHAVALGLTHEWSRKFAGVLASAGAAAQPQWYAGTHRFDFDTFENSFGSAVSSTSAPSERSSSGFSGGGSSGGGGGGGGGGGW